MRAASTGANEKRLAVQPSEAASAVVGYAMGNGPVPLGLDRPLDLLGGGARLEPGGMPMALGIDHVPGLRTFVADACRSSSQAGGSFYAQPPLALLGARGMGKGFAAHWIAFSAGVPLFRMSAGASSVRSVASTDQTEGRLPALPILAMACSRCANPLVVIELDADDPIDSETQEHLASMIDRRRNRRWVDDPRDAIFDLSHVSWLFEVHGRTPSDEDRRPVSPAALPKGLAALLEDGGTTIELTAAPHLDELRRLEVALSVCHGEGVRDADELAIVHDAVKAVRDPGDHRHRVPHAALVVEAHRVLATLRSGAIA